MSSELIEDDIVLIEYGTSPSGVPSLPAQPLPVITAPDLTNIQESTKRAFARPRDTDTGGQISKDCSCRLEMRDLDQTSQDREAPFSVVLDRQRRRAADAFLAPEVKRNLSEDHHPDNRERLEPIGFNPLSTLPDPRNYECASLRHADAQPQPPVSYLILFFLKR